MNDESKRQRISAETMCLGHMLIVPTPLVAAKEEKRAPFTSEQQHGPGDGGSARGDRGC